MKKPYLDTRIQLNETFNESNVSDIELSFIAEEFSRLIDRGIIDLQQRESNDLIRRSISFQNKTFNCLYTINEYQHLDSIYFIDVLGIKPSTQECF